MQVVRQVQNSTQRKMVVELFINSKSGEWAWRRLNVLGEAADEEQCGKDHS